MFSIEKHTIRKRVHKLQNVAVLVCPPTLHFSFRNITYVLEDYAVTILKHRSHGTQTSFQYATSVVNGNPSSVDPRWHPISMSTLDSVGRHPGEQGYDVTPLQHTRLRE